MENNDMRRRRNNDNRASERLYRTRANMIQRCTNEKHPAFDLYGGKGVTICDAWLNDYETFRTWALANGYRHDLTIDRIDGNGNYEPGNCRWVTQLVQIHNRNVNRLTLELAEEIRNRYRRGGTTMEKLATEYGLSGAAHICMVVNNRIWKI